MKGATTIGDEQDILPVMLPLYHIYGLIVILANYMRYNLMSKQLKLSTDYFC